MEAFSDFKALQDSISTSLVAATRTATQIANNDIPFFRSLDPSVARLLDAQNARLLALTERLLSNAANNTEVAGPRLPDADAVEGNWRGVVDVVDNLLEKADISMDEYTGAVKRLDSPSGDQTPTRTTPAPGLSRIAAALKSQNIPKPQLLFQNVPTNAETEPFKPLLTEKPNAITPLADLELRDEDGVPQYPNPYQSEIESYEFPTTIYKEAEPIPYRPFDTTTPIYVDTEEALAEMLQELQSASEIAIDLEHHDLRSYIGIVSLMQISTRDKDWVIDTLKPWRRQLQCLNIVFTNPRILKVLHGAFMDIVWLQRDLGLYIVGLFDTHHASRALGYPGGSLAFLLKKFVDFDAQKQYQTADWRTRPLPAEMLEYAQSDTHFLLYVFDNMRNELIQKSNFDLANSEGDKLNDVLVKSKQVALQTYHHPVYDSTWGLGAGGWYKLLRRTPALLSKQQFAVFRAVHKWRDQVAREQDDGVHYIMANHNIFSVAKEMPTEKAALFSVAQPLSQTLRLCADELLGVIALAKEQGVNGPEMHTLLSEIDMNLHGEQAVEAPAQASIWQVAASHAPATAESTSEINNTAAKDAQPLRSNESLFWGSSFENSAWLQQRVPTIDDISLPVPLPLLTAGQLHADGPGPGSIVTSGKLSIEGKGSTAVTPPSPPPDPRNNPDAEASDADIFTLKQRGRKRKSDQMTSAAPADGLATQADEIGLDDTSAQAQKAAESAARKAARKAEKRARKLAEEEDAARGAVEEPVFDYAAAPSVLHAADAARKEEGRRGKGKGKNKGAEGEQKPFNPYAKALDAPKGLPRAQKERAGKSRTFKA